MDLTHVWLHRAALDAPVVATVAPVSRLMACQLPALWSEVADWPALPRLVAWPDGGPDGDPVEWVYARWLDGHREDLASEFCVLACRPTAGGGQVGRAVQAAREFAEGTRVRCWLWVQTFDDGPVCPQVEGGPDRTLWLSDGSLLVGGGPLDGQRLPLWLTSAA